MLLALLAASGLAACSPALNWRATHAEGSGLVAMFPCRPDLVVRSVEIAGTRQRMEMRVCAAGGTTFAVGYVDVADDAAVSRTLERLQSAAVANIGGAAPRQEPLAIDGMAPNPHAAHLSFDGRLPDGSPVHEEAVFFARGLRVYQAGIIGRAPPPDAVSSFIAGLKLVP